MKPKFTPKKAGLLALALLAAMTAPATVHGATPVSAAPAGQPRGDQQASRLTTADDRVSLAEVPTLTNRVGQLSDGAEQQLSLGVGLIGVGLLALAIGLARLRAARREPPAAADPYASTSSATAAQPGVGTRFTLMRDDRRGRA